jgi:hydroxyquinol 1,2-dioxygenase
VRDIDEHTITGAVLESFAGTPDPRLGAIMQSLCRHLHDFVRDVEPTFEEWHTAIDFLTRTGKMCTDGRQEFILLSDVLGVSMLVDSINHRDGQGATPTTVLGPFYLDNPPAYPLGSNISAGMAGTPMYIDGRVTSASGKPLAGAVVDVWQSDGEGFYDLQLVEVEGPALRARLQCDDQGRFDLWSVAPSFYPIQADGPVGELLTATARHPNRPAHVHFMISHAGFETLTTHIFAEGSPYLDDDTVFGVRSGLIQPIKSEQAGRAPDGTEMQEPWSRLTYDFALKDEAPVGGASAPRLEAL